MFLRDHNKTALIYNDTHISYRELISWAGCYTDIFKVKKGQRVGILSENRPEWIYSFYAAWHYGSINVPMDITSSPEDLAHIIDDCTPTIILCSSGGRKLLNQTLPLTDHKPQIINFDETAPKYADRDLALGIPNADDVAVIMYTSGTTGRAKGVMLSYDNLLASIEGIVNLKMLLKEDILIGLLPFHHIFPFQGTILAPLHVGCSVAFVKSLTSDDILETLQRHRVTMFLGVPKLYELFHTNITGKINANPLARILFGLARIIKSQKFGRILFNKVHSAFGGNVHTYLTGGAKMEKRVAHDLWALGFRLVEGYGLTETAPLVAFNPFSKIKLGSVGPPMAGTEVKIENGEILVKGRNVMKGYYNLPDETARVLRDGWFHTGDTGHIDKDGYIYVTERIDDMIILPNGKNINPEEIEKKLISSSPFTIDVGIASREGRLIAYIHPDLSAIKREKIVNIRETIKWKVLDKYNATVPPYKRVMEFKISKEELPRTRLGKLKRFALPEIEHNDHSVMKSTQKIDIPEYEIIREHLEKITGLTIHPENHLELDLGMDSLSKVELMVCLESSFGIEFSETELATCPTVSELAEYVSRVKTISHREEINWKMILGEKISFKLPESGIKTRILAAVARPFIKLYFPIKHRGLDNLPEGPCIITPNHQSFLDSILLSSILPSTVLSRTFFLARESLQKSRVIRLLSRNANIIFINIDKDLKGALQKSAEILRRGKNLVIFPEGHRSRDGRMASFKKAFAILSKELNVPVIPLAISGAYNLFSRGSAFPKPGKVQMTFCKPVMPTVSDYDILTERVQVTIRNILENREEC